MTDTLPPSIVNSAPLPANEPERLEALRRYNILDTPPEKAFDRITSLAARLFNVPTVLVSLVDESRAWFKSCYGFNQPEIPRDATICSFALLYKDVLVVPDARHDERFSCNPFVQCEPGLRFYAGAPLLTAEGLNLGTLCLLDDQPRNNFTDEQKATLEDLAAMVMDELELRLAAHKIEQYANVVRNTPIGVVVWQLDDLNKPSSFRLVIANAAASEATGFDFTSVIGKTMAESFPQLLQTPLIQQYMDVVKTGRSLDLGEVPYSQDGITTGIYSLKAFPLPNHCLGLTFENITVRKQIETRLDESQHYNQQIAEALPGVLFVHDMLQQRNVYTNRQITDLLGYTSEDIQDMGTDAIVRLVHPDDLEQVVTYFHTFETATDDAVLGIEYRAHHANGEWRWLYTQSVVFRRTPDGAPSQILGVSIDISDRKQSEEALQGSEAWAQLAAQVAHLGAWRLHLDTNLVELDERMRQIWGEEDAVMVPLSQILERIHPDDQERVANAVNVALLEGYEYEVEYRIVWNDGSERWILAKGQAQFEGHGTARRIIDFFGTALDITERKRAEATLVDQEQRYRYIFEAVGVAIWEEDFSEAKAAIDRLKASGVEDFRQYFAEHPEFVQQMTSLVRVQDVNQASLDMFGATEKTELLSSLEQIFVPETEFEFVGELLAIAHEETHFAAETVVQTLQGDRRNVWFNITFPPASEPYDHVLVSLLDITQRKQVEAALQASEERYRYLAEATPQIVWTTDANGLITYFNPRWYDYTGMSEAESMGLGSPSAVHPGDRDRALQRWLTAVEDGEEYEIEIRLRRWDGVYRWHLVRGVPMRDPNGEIVSWVGTNTDIDDQKHIQEALRQSEERLSLALRSAQAGMWQWSKADNQMIWSEEAFRMLGYEPEQCSATHNAWVQVVHPDDRARAEHAIQQALDNNESLYSEYRVCLPDGSIRWLADIGQVTYDEQDNQTGMIGIQIDISKRKQIELERERSEAILNAFLKASPIALTLFDPDLRYLYANEALAQINGLPLSDHLGRPMGDVVPDIAPRFASMLQRTLETQEPVLNLEYQGEVRPGVYRHTLANHFPVCLPDGEVLGVGVSVTDITELKRIEAELRQSEERLSLALKATNQGLYDLNVQTGDAIVSPEYARMLGYEPEEFQETNANWRDRLHPDDVLMVYRVYEEYVAGLHDEYRVEFRQRTKTGAWIWILSIGKIVSWDDEGNPMRMLGTHTDISDRKQAEQTLQQHSERLNLLYEATSALLSSQQPLDLLNQLFHRLSAQLDLHYYYQFKLIQQNGQPRLQLMNYSGLSEEQVQEFKLIEIGQSMCGLVAQERRQIVLNQSEIATHTNACAIFSMGVLAYAGQPLMVHGRLLGTLSFASLTRTQFTLEEANLLQAISEQVAIALDRAELVTSLQQQTEDLVQANRVKDEFLAVLSHELRSPLNPILGWTKLLQTGNFDAQKTKQALEIIERNAKQQTQLIDDLLDISKILRGKLVLSEVPVDLALTIEAALETVRLAAEAKNIEIKTDFTPFLPPVLGDTGRLQQVVLNLLSNAIKFTPNGGQVEVRLERVESGWWMVDSETSQSPSTIHHPPSTAYAQIQVKDTGKGIAPDFLPYVFDSFRQEDGRTTRKFGGLGLGLAIVRQLTELHGGTVQAESKGEGMGATFTVRLPLMRTASLSSNDLLEAGTSTNEALALQGIRILVVDDEDDMRDLVVTIAEQAGAIAQTARSATEALQILDQFQPTLLVSDIGMPDVDGYMFIQQIRALPPEQGGLLPAIALTAYASESDQQLALQAGFQKHLSKPIEPDQLIKTIVNLVSSL